MTERLVVIGGDAAGLSAATNARRRRGPADLEIVVFERGEWISFSACGEPYYVSGVVEPFEQLLVRSPEDFRRRDIAVHRWHEVTTIDTEARTVAVRDLRSGTDRVVEYDYLMYATGAAARFPDIPGCDLAKVHTMHRLEDARTVRRIIEEERPQRAVVVGGGYVGLEMAEAFLDSGLDTTIITQGIGLLTRNLDPEMVEVLVDATREAGVRVLPSTRVEAFEGRDGRVTGVRAGDETIPADLVLLAVGVVPAVALAREAGIALGESGAIRVDELMRTSAPGVYAGGDCVESTHRISGRAVNYHLGTLANKQGRVAGLNIGGADERFPGTLGTAITKLDDIEIATTGLTERAATSAGFEVAGAMFATTTMANYWPESRPMTVKVVVERHTGRLLGAQIIGGPTAGKRIDALAMALWTGMTAEELVNVDLSYAPPFSAVWDPVLVAARKAIGALEPSANRKGR